MAVPMQSNSNGILSRYIQWLLSQIQSASGTQGGAVNPMAALFQVAPQADPTQLQALAQLAGGYPTPSAGPAYGGDLGLSMRTAVRGLPGSFAGLGAETFGTPNVDTATLMQQASTMSPDETLTLLRGALNVGGYQFPDMSKANIDAIARAWEDLNAGWQQTGDAFRATYDPVSGYYATRTNEGFIPLDPNSNESNRMASLFNRVINGASADALLSLPEIQSLGLTEQEKIDLKRFEGDERTRREAQAKIAAEQNAFAQTYGLPSPSAQWEITPEVAGAIWQRQKTGLTDTEAARQAMDVAGARYENAREYYVPKDADQLRKEAMARVVEEARREESRYQDNDGRVVRGINPAEERKAQWMAETAAAAAGGGADRAESAASRAYTSVMKPPPTISREQQKDIDRMVQEGVWSEGYKAMRGVKTGGGDQYREYQLAKKAFDRAKTSEEKLAAQIAMDLTDRVGTPFADAIVRARALVNAQSKDYPRPSGPVNTYPYNR